MNCTTVLAYWKMESNEQRLLNNVSRLLKENDALKETLESFQYLFREVEKNKEEIHKMKKVTKILEDFIEFIKNQPEDFLDQRFENEPSYSTNNLDKIHAEQILEEV